MKLESCQIHSFLLFSCYSSCIFRAKGFFILIHYLFFLWAHEGIWCWDIPFANRLFSWKVNLFFDFLLSLYFDWTKNLCECIDFLMSRLLKYLSKQLVYLLYYLVLFSQNLLVEFFLLFEDCVWFSKYFLIGFGFVLVKIRKVLEK